MASLRTSKKSRFYYACYTDRFGVQRQKSTKTADKRKAKEIADTIEKTERKIREEGQSISVVIDHYDALLKSIGAQSRLKTTTADWFDEWMNNKQKAIKLNSKKAYGNIINGLKIILGSKINQHLENVTTADIIKYRDSELEGGLVARTVNQKLKIASQIFSDARNHGIIKINPVELTERASAKTGTGQEPFSVDQVRTLIQNSDQDWKGIILIAYSTGFRLKDCATLKWSNLDKDRKFIIIETGKTAFPIKIPIESNLRKWLISREKNKESDWILPSLANKSGSGKSGLSTIFGKIMKKSGIFGKVTMTGHKRGRTRSSLGFHSLRHTYVTELTKNGIPEELRMKLSAHTTRQSHQIYTHHEQSQLESAISSLPSVV